MNDVIAMLFEYRISVVLAMLGLGVSAAVVLAAIVSVVVYVVYFMIGKIALLDFSKDRIKMYIDIADEAKYLCDLICNSPPDTMIKGEIESCALSLGHLIKRSV